ncbi:chemotaxis protein CheW [Geobacter pelophilus]|uniref:Chemotaxis protein CheW n=1 Tax=Geoanaerobacter pelophilus TaxID=60036 RepID=A0AAW4L6U9_9BACT|nr:chemotaxis protein CheW [Geoanaerobacter pelophilus]MBT0662981.1 chemotaxis protein CheW [Geoanaerobacter pelophilus]
MYREIQEIQVACFRLGDDLYAIDIMRIKEIIRPLKLTCLPKFPDFVEGIINLRGIVMPVVDLRKRFGLPELETTSNTRLLIVNLAGQVLALVVDEVTEVVTVAVKDIKPPPNLGEGIGTEYLLGVCLVKQEMIMLLNIDKLLSTHEARELGKINGGLKEA